METAARKNQKTLLFITELPSGSTPAPQGQNRASTIFRENPQTNLYSPAVSFFEFDSVSLSFAGRGIFRDFSAAIREGEKVVLRAPSGSGKSSLLRLLLGFLRPDAGEVRYRSQPLTAALAWKLRRETSYVNQSIDLGDGSVRQGIESLCHLRHHSHRPDQTAMRDALSIFDLGGHILDQATKELSGGERQRVALAIALLLDRPVCLLDEPAAALDASLKKRVAARFLDPADRRTVIAASHDESWFDQDAVTVIDLPAIATIP
jgi:putative ABC transport system ATP-binding protein